MPTRTLYSIYERTGNRALAKRFFRNRKIKGAKVLNMAKEGGMTRVEFIKFRKKRR